MREVLPVWRVNNDRAIFTTVTDWQFSLELTCFLRTSSCSFLLAHVLPVENLPMSSSLYFPISSGLLAEVRNVLWHMPCLTQWRNTRRPWIFQPARDIRSSPVSINLWIYGRVLEFLSQQRIGVFPSHSFPGTTHMIYTPLPSKENSHRGLRYIFASSPAVFLTLWPQADISDFGVIIYCPGNHRHRVRYSLITRRPDQSSAMSRQISNIAGMWRAA